MFVLAVAVRRQQQRQVEARRHERGTRGSAVDGSTSLRPPCRADVLLCALPWSPRLLCVPASWTWNCAPDDDSGRPVHSAALSLRSQLLHRRTCGGLLHGVASAVCYVSMNRPAAIASGGGLHHAHHHRRFITFSQGERWAAPGQLWPPMRTNMTSC
jgi:hypothetical protein